MSFLYSLPLEVRSILKKIRKGKILLQVEHKGYEPLVSKMELISNKVVLSLVISALLIAASISLNSSTPVENFTGLPYISLIELVIALILGVILIIAMLKGGNSERKNGNGQESTNGKS